jgi:hypothetical protein
VTTPEITLVTPWLQAKELKMMASINLLENGMRWSATL